METLQTYERMVHILCLKGHDTQKASVKAHLTVKDEFYRETDLFGKKIAVDKILAYFNCYDFETKERKYT